MVFISQNKVCLEMVFWGGNPFWPGQASHRDQPASQLPRWARQAARHAHTRAKRHDHAPRRRRPLVPSQNAGATTICYGKFMLKIHPVRGLFFRQFLFCRLVWSSVLAQASRNIAGKFTIYVSLSLLLSLCLHSITQAFSWSVGEA